VVNGREGAVCAADLAASVAKTLERLRRSDLVHKVTVNEDEGVALARVNDVVVKDLVVEGAGGSGRGRHGGVVEWSKG
jgi:hypothetical protein